MSEVPRVIHWWWDGPPVPPEYLGFRDRWAELHPGWSLLVWNEERFLAEFAGQPVVDLYQGRRRWSPRAHEWGWKTNIARYAILQRYGGLWVDADLEPLKPVDRLVIKIESPGSRLDALAAYEDRQHVNNAFLASAPEGSFITQVVQGLRSRIQTKRGKPSNVATGPHYLTSMVGHPGLLVLDRALIYPMHWSELDQRHHDYPAAYTLHHWHRKTTEQVRGKILDRVASALEVPRELLDTTPTQRKVRIMDVPHRIRNIAGLTPESIGVTLADLAAQVPRDRAIVELGVYQGRTLLFMAWGARQGAGAHVYGIDPWDLPGERGPYRQNQGGALGKHRKAFTDPGTRAWARYNVKALGYANQVKLIRNFSVKAAEKWNAGPVGLLFVDGDHNYDAVRKDVAAWARHLADDAVIAFDDHADTHPEVIQAVADMVEEGILEPIQLYHDRLAVTRMGSGHPELVRREQVQDQVVRGEWVTDPAGKVDLSPDPTTPVDETRGELKELPEIRQAEQARRELERVVWQEVDISIPRGGIQFPETAEPPAKAPPETAEVFSQAPVADLTTGETDPDRSCPMPGSFYDQDHTDPPADEGGSAPEIIDVPLPDPPPEATTVPATGVPVTSAEADELDVDAETPLEDLNVVQLRKLAGLRGVTLGRDGKTRPVALAKLRGEQ